MQLKTLCQWTMLFDRVSVAVNRKIQPQSRCQE